MNARTALAAAVAAAMMTMTVSLFAAETAPRKSEPIVGYGMMNDGERNDYRKRMREARSEQELQAIRDEHRRLMETRAKERGTTLPGPRGAGAGKGPGGEGKGPGYGPGGQGKGGKGPGPEGKGKGYGPGGKGKGYGPEGKDPGDGPGYGKGPGTGMGPGYGPGLRQ